MAAETFRGPLCGAAPVKCVGVNDRFTETGPYDTLLDDCGLAVADIVKAAHNAVGAKKE